MPTEVKVDRPFLRRVLHELRSHEWLAGEDDAFFKCETCDKGYDEVDFIKVIKSGRPRHNPGCSYASLIEDTERIINKE